jgi:phosphate transport system protein
MSIHLHRDLEYLQRRIVSLASAVEQRVDTAIRALLDWDNGLAQSLLESDLTIDLEENEVEEECLKILALHQPVAVDLRRVAAVLKINTDLERMADLAVNIAERASALTPHDRIPIPPTFRQMTDVTNSMVRDALDSFVDLNVDLALRVCRMDDEVDRHNRAIIEQIIQFMKQSPDHVESGLHLFSAARHLERIADHATNIAEDVVYLVEGRIIRHHPEALGKGET